MSNPFAPIFPSDEDPPLVINGRFDFDVNDRRRIDTQIRTIQQYLLSQGTSSSSDTQASTFAMPNSNTSLPSGNWGFGIIILTGSPSAPRTLTVPTTNGTAQRKVLINLTTQAMTIAPAGGGATVVVSSLQPAWLAFDGTDMGLIGGDGNATKIQGVPVDPTAPTGDGAVPRYTSASTNYIARRLTNDDIDAGFVPTLSYTGGGSSPVEIGTLITPTFSGNPLPNGAGVTLYNISDNQGGGPTSRLGSGSGFQGPSASYTINAPGNLGFSASVTKNGINKPATAPNIAVETRVYSGFGPSTAATGLTQASNNATVVGPTASLTGQLAQTIIGVQTLFGLITPSNNFWWVFWDQQYGSTHTFKDKATGFAMDMFATVYGFVSTTQTGVPGRTWYGQRSLNNLGTTPIEPYFDT